MELDIIDFWRKDPIDRKGSIFILGIEERMNESLTFLQKQYPRYGLLKTAVEFMDIHHSDAIKSTLEQYETIGYVPTIEAEMELDHAIKHALVGSYKASFADLRRAIELTLLGVYFVDSSNKKDSINWLQGNLDTPFFSTITRALTKEGRFKDFDKNCDWIIGIKVTYYGLSDYSHNKGLLRGYKELGGIRSHISGTTVPSININTLETLCDFYIKTVQEIVVILILYNPIILVGLPLDEKFGINGPMSGFYNEGQSELVKKLIPEKYREYFDSLSKTDPEVVCLRNIINGMSDITEVEFESQIEDFKKNFPNTH